MKKKIIIAILFLISLMLCYLGLKIGTYNINLSQMISIMHNPDDNHYFALVEYRLPRVILAFFLGSALALSGVLVQSIIRNPLASPEILGINNAAGLSAVLLLSFIPDISVYTIPIFGFFAGGLAFIILFFICGKNFSPMRMALIGVALSAFYSAISQYIMLAYPLEINLAMLWLTGSLWGRTWDFVNLIVPPLIMILPISLLLIKRLDILTLGSEKAYNLGINVRITRIITLTIAVFLSSLSVSVCGPISFLGLVAPHMARKIIGGRHCFLIPATMLIGSILLQLSDIIARTIAPPMELPAGILTAIIGAPYFFWLLMRDKNAT